MLQLKDNGKTHRYIRRTFEDGKLRLVVCCTENMAKLAQRATSLIVDSTFKLVRVTWNTFVIASFDNTAQRAVVLARVFTNSLSEDAHQK
jgi:hypothetical protein